jgi:hypothetical protein
MNVVMVGRLPSRRPRAWAGVGIVVYVVLAGAAVAVNPFLLVVGTLVVALPVVAYLRPDVGVYVLLALTPLTAGIDRGHIVPLLRPNEVIFLLVGAGVGLRRLSSIGAGERATFRLLTTDTSLFALAFFGSVVPLLWMLARSRSISQDDLLYTFVLPKYFAIYLVVKAAIRTERQVRICLMVVLASGAVVAIVAILQALLLFHVPALLAKFYAPYGDTEALYLNRGGSTLANPLAVADVMVITLAVTVGFVAKGLGRRWLLIGLGTLYIVGCVASGEFSGALALLVGLLAVGAVTGRFWRPLAFVVPALIVAGLILQPVIDRRLSDAHATGGVPSSWTERVSNLETYFLPDLRHDFQWVLGVRPSARVARGTNDYVFIESGYIELLWTGGIPLLVAAAAFLSANLRATATISRRRHDAAGIAAIGAFTALAVIAVLDLTDPHLTLRGAGDVTFALLALAYVRNPSVARAPTAVRMVQPGTMAATVS